MLIDFDAIGYKARAFFVVWVADNRIEEFLINHKNINTLYKIKGHPELLAEVIFENEDNLKRFFDGLAKMGATVEHQYNLHSTIRKEEFLKIKI